MGDLDFTNLLEQSRQLVNKTNKPGFVVTRSLQELERESKKLVAKSGVDGVSAPLDAKAQMILAQKGFDAEKQTKSINSLDLARTFESLEPLSETDIEGYLAHEHEMTIVSAIEEVQKDTVTQFQDSTFRAMELDWERMKRQIFEELGHQATEVSSFDSEMESAESSVALAPRMYIKAGTAFGSTMSETPSLKMHSKMKNYSSIVASLNNARLNKDKFRLVSSFKSVAEKLDGKSAEAVQAWDIMLSITDEANGPDENRFYDRYRDPRSPADVMSLNREIVGGAKRFLEKQYLEHVRKTVDSHPARAQLGGRPGIEEEIKAFLKVRLPPNSKYNSVIPNDEPNWALLYYLMRCGSADMALKIAKTKQRHQAGFLNAFTKYVEDFENMTDTDTKELLPEFKRVPEDDSYKAAVLKIVGRCDLARKTVPGVTLTTEDYLWLQLALVRDPKSETPTHEIYTLADLQAELNRLGSNYFDPDNSKPFKYFRVLLLSGQFERALEHLHRFENYQVEAVHLAIALNYYGLLRLPNPKTAFKGDMGFLIVEGENVPVSFDFTRMIYRYTRLFYKSDPEEALHYLFLAATENPVTCNAYIQEVVFDTRQFTQLLGEMRIEKSEPGFIFRYAKLVHKTGEAKEHTTDLTLKVAKRSEESGNLEDAIHLYNLAEDYNKVLRLIIDKLGSGATRPNNQLKEEAQRVVTFYSRQPYIFQKLDKSLIEICRTLVYITDFFRFAQAGQDDQALMCIESTGLLPIGDQYSIPQLLAGFDSLHMAIKRNFEDIITTTMDLLYRMYTKLQGFGSSDQGRQKKLWMVKKQASDLVKFAGGNKSFQMRREVYSRLSQRETLMN